jgi:enoyl-CoA hydratase
MTDSSRLDLRVAGRVATVTISRPEALNALDHDTMVDLLATLHDLDADTAIGAIVLTGVDRAFAAGADVAQMAGFAAPEIREAEWFAEWQQVGDLGTPTIAAVRGFALGGGCELAMLCDIVVAGESARFGQPEITLGIIPGMGGTQRLVRAVGKSLAMELILTGRMLSADEARAAGLVSRVVADDDVVAEAEGLAAKVAAMPRAASRAAKEAVAAAFELPLSAGVRLERRLFQMLFATAEQKEGMTAFLEKRPARFHPDQEG